MSVFNVFSTEMEKELLQRRYHTTTTTTTISSVPVAAAAVVVGQSKNGRNNSVLFNRFHYDPSSTASDSFSNSSFYTSSSKNSSFEVIFSRLLDILIFTSAIAITAISYLKGTLRPMVEAPPITHNHNLPYNQKRHSHSEGSYNKPLDPIEDSKRRRTQEWAEQVLTSTTRSCPTSTNNKKRSCSTTVLIDNKKVK